MSTRSYRLYLLDMGQACQDIIEFTRDPESGDALQADRRTMLAVTRCLEIIGEAAWQIPVTFQEQHPAIPWREVINFRNVMAHEYFGIDYEIVWDVIQTEIPSLWKKVTLLLDQLPEEPL
jgi:uncharacterized protein with HEPN domain